MGRKPGSKNKAKPGETAPSAGHNSGLSEGEKRALLLRGMVELENLLREKNEIVADIRNQRKRMVAYGFEPFEIDYALKLRRNKDGDEIERRRKEAMIARFLGHPIGTQPDMFSDEPDRTPAVDRAFDLGKVAGAEGKAAQSPHSPGTDQDQAWLRGWHDGQAELMSGFKKLEAAGADEDQAELEAA